MKSFVLVIELGGWFPIVYFFSCLTQTISIHITLLAVKDYIALVGEVIINKCHN